MNTDHIIAELGLATTVWNMGLSNTWDPGYPLFSEPKTQVWEKQPKPRKTLVWETKNSKHYSNLKPRTIVWGYQTRNQALVNPFISWNQNPGTKKWGWVCTSY